MPLRQLQVRVQEVLVVVEVVVVAKVVFRAAPKQAVALAVPRRRAGERSAAERAIVAHSLFLLESFLGSYVFSSFPRVLEWLSYGGGLRRLGLINGQPELWTLLSTINSLALRDPIGH